MGEYRRHLGRRVLLHLDNATIDGTLLRTHRDTVTVHQARLVTAGEGSVMDGEIVVERARLVWMQVVPA